MRRSVGAPEEGRPEESMPNMLALYDDVYWSRVLTI